MSVIAELRCDQCGEQSDLGLVLQPLSTLRAVLAAHGWTTVWTEKKLTPATRSFNTVHQDRCPDCKS